MNWLFTTVLFTIGLASYAQLVVTFPKDEKFFKELGNFMTSNRMEQNISVMNELESMVKAGKITPTWYPYMASVCNVMAERQMSANNHFNPYIKAVIAAAKSGLSEDKFKHWNEFLTDVIENQKKGDNSNYLKTIEFSRSFFEENALNSTPAKKWVVDTRDYTLKFEDGKAKVSIPACNLTGMVKGDTIIIKQTSGDYLPIENRWEGKSGRVDWQRVGLDPAKVYCTFKNYTINLTNFSYTVDTVLFVHTDYFKTPLYGRLTDKLVSSADSATLSYPRFESYNVNLTIKDIAPNVSYTGGFSLWGAKFIGRGNTENKGSLIFYARDGKTPVLRARSNGITFRQGEEIGAEKAEVSIYFGNDSIYHPQLNVVYKIQKREIRLLRGETGMGKAKFIDSYHNHEFQTDAIFWNLDSSVLNLKILSGVGQKPGVFESVNYFDRDLIRKMQGFTSYEPLSILRRLYEKNGSRDLSALEVAKAFDPKLTESEARSIFYLLVENGFINYNEEQGIVTVRDKTLNYVLANSKKIDYDIIKIRSVPQTGNDRIDLRSSNIDLKGVAEIPISDSAYVYFRPKDQSVSLQRDRNMEFDGLIYAGRMDFYGQKFKFQYAPFTVDLLQVDTLVIHVQDSGKVDREGNPILKPLRSRVENLKGLLEIDAPINKSGRTKLPQFPRLYSREKSYIYYDDPTVAKGAYNRKNFYFEIDPFRLDSLNNFSASVINWKGKFVSAGILPDLRDSVSIQPDGSLGFKSETPKNGYDLYKGKGKYYGKFELNYNGLAGEGRITHSTAAFSTPLVRFYPDSMLANTDSFTIAKTFEGVKTPSVRGYNDRIFWRPNADSMHIYMGSKDVPFAMYDDGLTTFKGELLLTGKGLRGNGTLDWSEATLTSKDFSFQTMNLSADTASLNIKTTGDKVTFKTPNVSAKVDFKTRIGDFVSNQKNIPTDFTYNQYRTNINEFKWFMDEKILDFKAPPQGPGEIFTSTRAEQKGLNFLGKRATYNLATSVLRIEQVPEIKVADASVIPDSGIVIIEEAARMRQLKNAVIIADTLRRWHKIENATVDIYSKSELRAKGDYTYLSKGNKQSIHFADIGTKKSNDPERKKDRAEHWNIYAKADISENQNFFLYPSVRYNGDVLLTSVDSLLFFKGFAKLDLKHPKAVTSDFAIKQYVDPNRLELKFDSVRNSRNTPLHAGIHINPFSVEEPIYATVLGPKSENKDISIFRATGIVTQKSSGEYLLGSPKKITDNKPAGNLMVYDDKKGVIKAEGRFNLGANFGIIKTLAAGSADVYLDSNKYKFNLTLGLNMRLDDKIQERLEFYMAGDNIDLTDINYDNDKQKKAIAELCDEKEDKKLYTDFEATGQFNKRPKALTHNWVFSDVNFVFDSADVSLRSVGKIGLAMVGKKVINKKLDGYIEIQYKGGADLFTIYLKTGTNDWVYFEYRPGTLGVLSSYDDINTMVSTTPPDKRRVKGENDRFYLFTLGSSMNKTDFMEYMKDKANGINRPRYEPKLDLPLPGDTLPPLDSVLVPGPVDDGYPVQQEIITPDQREEIERQRELQRIYELEKLKLSGGGIFSAPPPDRTAPKQDEAPKPNNQEAPQPENELKEENPGEAPK
ncbi:MAG: hypothetical protein NZM35_08745 [Chitinophagales bacterium]|nr:hypothetical protein [Chitinophagales bacterium]MDW8418953.1 hypothetical protein [Chitinophagales bacterium]